MIDYFKENMKILEDSIESLSSQTWEQVISNCVETIKNNGKIIASGLGKNVPICEKFVGTLNSFGIPAAFLHSNTAVHGDLGIIKNNDLVFILSKSGNTIESVELTEHILQRKTKLWLLSCAPSSKLTNLIDNHIILNLIHEGDLWNIAPNNSATVFLIFLQGVAVELSKRLNINLDEFKMNHPGGAIGEKLLRKNIG